MSSRLPTLLLFTATLAMATPTDPRGWTPGKPAVGSERILKGPDRSQLPELEFPKDLAKRLDRRTVLFYFSPGCPHCQAVGEEVGQLGRDLPDEVQILGIATGSSLPADVDAFAKAYGIDFPILIDEKREIGAAMGARSTPSMLMVEPTLDKRKHAIVDVWYPYQPGFDVYVRMRGAKDPWSVMKGYQGNGACIACHQQEAESWALTHHSVAWRTLEKGEKTDDPKCVGCHVTGHEQEGGWTPGNLELTGVGCEACHGPSGPHDGQVTDPKSTCVGCHDAEHSIQFSYAKGLPLIDHFAATALSDEAFREKRLAMLDGEAPRTLLAFADDPTVGAEACKSCHEAEYAQWAGSPHRHAMQILRDAEQESDPACVACHATATRGGPPPTALADFRVDESVGCETCHGPGSAHVKAGGGTDNIEKLGDDCPVCVIEAVCTSCHVEKWDPDWNLERDLPKVGHGG